MKRNLNQDSTSSCDDYLALISAMVDGELDPDEQVELTDHLDGCPACQEWLFQIGELEGYLQVAVFDEGNSVAAPVKPKPKARRGIGGGLRSIARWIPFATAAAVLVGLFVVAMPTESSTLTAEQVVAPVNDLKLINRHHERDQKIMLKTIEIELQALRLEVEQLRALDDLAPEHSERIGRVISKLLDRVKYLESSISSFDTGDESEAD